MQIITSALTDVGMKRKHNEDNVLLVDEESLVLVADGVGGHSSGEVASALAVESISNFFKKTTDDEERTWPFKENKGLKYEENRLVISIKYANAKIFEKAQDDPRKRGMGTTIVAALFSDDSAYIAHCGDSRAYLFREGKIKQLSEDHSLLNDFLKTHPLTPEEIERFPHKNIILRALGMKSRVQVDIQRVDPKVGDIFLLCSDGLSGMITDEEIENTIQSHEDNDQLKDDLDDLGNILIKKANANGGTDNISVACAKIKSLT